MINTSSTYNISFMYSLHSLYNNTRVTCSSALSGHPSSSLFVVKSKSQQEPGFPCFQYPVLQSQAFDLACLQISPSSDRKEPLQSFSLLSSYSIMGPPVPECLAHAQGILEGCEKPRFCTLSMRPGLGSKHSEERCARCTGFASERGETIETSAPVWG